MTQYVSKCYIADDCALDPRETLPTMDVCGTDDKMVDTGVLNASGEKIYRVREAVGFIK
jgi:hypothetical protein